MLRYNGALFSEQYHSKITIRVEIARGFEQELEEWFARLIMGQCFDVVDMDYVLCSDGPWGEELDCTVGGIKDVFTKAGMNDIFSVARTVRDDILSAYVMDGTACVWIAMYTEDVLMTDLVRGCVSETYCVDLDKFLSVVEEC